MKKLLTLIIIFTLGSSAHAQHNYIGLAMGGSIPTGKYSGVDNPYTSGYATPSFTLDFEALYSFSPNIGIAAVANYGMNGVEATQLQSDLVSYYRDKYPGIPDPLPEEAEVRMDINQWTYVNLMTGPVASLPVSSFIFEVRALAGLSFTMPPERSLSFDYLGTHLSSEAQGQSLRFGYILGTSIIYKPHSTGIRLGADYLSTNTKVKVQDIFENGLDPAASEGMEIEMPLNAINITLGIISFF